MLPHNPESTQGLCRGDQEEWTPCSREPGQAVNASRSEYGSDQLSNLGATLNVVPELPVAPSTDVIITITVDVADVVPIDVVGLTNTLFSSGQLQSQVTMRQEVPPPAGICT